MIPERIVPGQWLRFGDVDNGLADLPRVQCAEQILMHELRPSPYLDKCRAARQASQETPVKDSCCFGREWQEAHQDVAARQKRGQLILPAVAHRTLDDMK